jgi:hypothetical protein
LEGVTGEIVYMGVTKEMENNGKHHSNIIFNEHGKK